MARKNKQNSLKTLIEVLWFIIKIPYYIAMAIIYVLSLLRKEVHQNNIKKNRELIQANYEEFSIVEKEKGDFDKFLNTLYNSENKIGLIIGARGTGKTALGIRYLENLYYKKQKKIYAMGFDEIALPSWINVINDITELRNDSVVLIDEGGILFSSRSAMSNPNKLLSNLILVSRHKNITILFISQNSSNLEINILRQADFILLKPSSLLQKEFERKIIQKIYDSIENKFRKYESIKGITYVYSNDFQGFISNTLPSFWQTSISKSFKYKK